MKCVGIWMETYSHEVCWHLDGNVLQARNHIVDSIQLDWTRCICYSKLHTCCIWTKRYDHNRTEILTVRERDT